MNKLFANIKQGFISVFDARPLMRHTSGFFAACGCSPREAWLGNAVAENVNVRRALGCWQCPKHGLTCNGATLEWR